jgi:hypothetical protein
MNAALIPPPQVAPFSFRCLAEPGIASKIITRECFQQLHEIQLFLFRQIELAHSRIEPGVGAAALGAERFAYAQHFCPDPLRVNTILGSGCIRNFCRPTFVVLEQLARNSPNMNSRCSSLILVMMLVLSTLPKAHAISVTLEAPDSGAVTGAMQSVIVGITGLDGPVALGDYDLELLYDPLVLSLLTIGFMGNLGVAEATGGDPGGRVMFGERSLESPLDLMARQVDAFTIVSLLFVGINAGATPLTLRVNRLADTAGNALAVDSIATGELQVRAPGVAISEPSTLYLVLLALLTACGFAAPAPMPSSSGKKGPHQRRRTTLWSWQYRKKARGRATIFCGDWCLR